MKKANPKAVGGFVVVAVILAVIAVGVFGSGRFFDERRLTIAYFPGSLSGLRVGAPVTLRGVQIGTVRDLWVEANMDVGSEDFRIPVIMEIEMSRIRNFEEAEEQSDEDLDDLIERGFRARLAADSLVTGQLSVIFDFLPGTPIVLTENQYPYEQIPTVESDIDQFKSSVDRLVDSVNGAVLALDGFLTQENQQHVNDILANAVSISEQVNAQAGDVTPILREIRNAVQAYDELAEDLDAVVAENREPLGDAIIGLRDTSADYAELGENIDALVADLSPEIKKAVAGLVTMEETVTALADSTTLLIEENRRGITDFSNGGLYEINNLAVDAQAAVEQFRRVMEEMERNPARFFLGDQGQVEVQ
ncbi:MAG: MlaD family protein [Alphaproteobacteria bacterium]|nr:MlaD family protein [Alphaproteobacteria bacterium]